MSKPLLQTRATDLVPRAFPAPVADSQSAGGPTLQASGHNRLAMVLLRRKVKALFRHFPAALTGHEEAIHQLRVSGRRLRIALPLLVAKPDGRRAERACRLLRQLTRAAGSSRDLDVLIVCSTWRSRDCAAISPG